MTKTQLLEITEETQDLEDTKRETEVDTEIYIQSLLTKF